MPLKRKPPIPIPQEEELYDDSVDSGVFDSTERKYQEYDRLSTVPEETSSYQQIDNAVTALQTQRNTGLTVQSRHADNVSLDSRQSRVSSDQGTVIDQDAPLTLDNEEAYAQYSTYPQGQQFHLPTINSGDLLQPDAFYPPTQPLFLDEDGYDMSTHGPFEDMYEYDTHAYGDRSYKALEHDQDYPIDPQQRSRSPSPDSSYYNVGNDTLEYLKRDQAFRGEYHSKEVDPSAKPEDSTRHYGPAPVGPVMRRNKVKKRIALTNGHLVTELSIPKLLTVPRQYEEETRTTRYTAVTCDPDDFEREGFFLRQNNLGRRTELFIVVTMYNEDEVLLTRTLFGIMKNISHLCTRKNSSTWGPDSWKKVVVCIVADGRKNIHPGVMDVLTTLGVYQEGGHMKNFVNGEPVQAHLFEYTTTFALDPGLKFRFPDKGIVPTQMIFCLKEKNQKKINSHRWFFNAFAPLLQPNICVLLDVGTRPGHKSLYHLWKAFDLNSNVGGACGEIAAYKGHRWKGLLNPLVASQNFEYKMSNILDKTTESVFGYISVLPGAFSAYRWIALQNDKAGVGPLASYFKGEVLNGREADLLTSNMYLAEDRILCFELVAKRNSNWILKYVKSAVGTTDVPDRLSEFISQRRRWLNGAFFAAIYALAHTGQVMQSGHSFGRKCSLLTEAAYNLLGLVFAWFAIGNYYIFFVIVTSSLNDASPVLAFINAIVQYIYVAAVIACFILSMGNKPRSAPSKYRWTAIFFAALTLYMIIHAIICIVKASRSIGSKEYSQMLVSLLATYCSYAAASLLAFDPWHLLTSFFQYTLMSGTYINILNIFAFCNLDDISWGTKQEGILADDLGAVVQDSHSQVDLELVASSADDAYAAALQNIQLHTPSRPKPQGNSVAEQQQAAKDYYASVRTNVLLVWVLSNGILVAGILNGSDVSGTFDQNSNKSRKTRAYTLFILAIVAVSGLTRMIGATCYFVVWMFTG